MTWFVLFCLLSGANSEKDTDHTLLPTGWQRQSIPAWNQSKDETLYISVVSIRTGNFVKTIPNLYPQLPWAWRWFGFPYWTRVGWPHSAFSVRPVLSRTIKFHSAFFISLLVWNWIRQHHLFLISNTTIPGLLGALPVRAVNVPRDELHIHSDASWRDGGKKLKSRMTTSTQTMKDGHYVSDAFG